MEEKYSELSTYLLIKRYQAEQDKNSTKAIELDKLIREDLKIPESMDLLSNDIQEKFNKIVGTEKRKNEKFINITAWIFIIILGASLLGSGCGLMSMNSTSRLLPKIDSLYSENISPIFRFFIEHQMLITVISFVISLVMFFIAIGILYRSDFARKIGIAFLIYEIVKAFASPLLVKYVYPSIRDFNYQIPQSMRDSMYNTSIVMSLFLSIIFILIYGWLIYKFTSSEITEEFK